MWCCQRRGLLDQQGHKDQPDRLGLPEPRDLLALREPPGQRELQDQPDQPGLPRRSPLAP